MALSGAVAVRSHVGNRGITGLVVLTVSFVDPDPQRTSAPLAGCKNVRDTR
jgi:hypothetical protein